MMRVVSCTFYLACDKRSYMRQKYAIKKSSPLYLTRSILVRNALATMAGAKLSIASNFCSEHV